MILNRNNNQNNTNSCNQSCIVCYTLSKNYLQVWLKNSQSISQLPNIVEVVFKNHRKEFFENREKIKLKIGDFVVVESSPGHDIGKINMTDDLFFNQKSKEYLSKNKDGLKKIYSLANKYDLKRLKEARSIEKPTLVKARKIIRDLKLKMKLSEVEYQGDKKKAYFYYIADERVDFRALIKLLAEEFHLQVVMKQIGARQETAYVSGLGICGRRLCCSAWLNKLESISANVVKAQDIPMNPQKLTGQCGKLKCCLNYELKTYQDAKNAFPPTNRPIQTEEGKAIHIKSDILNGILWYAYEDNPLKITPLNIKQVKQILHENKQGKKVKSIFLNEKQELPTSPF